MRGDIARLCYRKAQRECECLVANWCGEFSEIIRRKEVEAFGCENEVFADAFMRLLKVLVRITATPDCCILSTSLYLIVANYCYFHVKAIRTV